MTHPVYGEVPQIRMDVLRRNDLDAENQIQHFVKTELLPQIPKSARLISIDGFDGVGKSTLTKPLGEELGFQSVNLDDFLEKNQNCYFEALRYSELRDSIAEKPRLIVEGCLVQDVLSRLGVSPDYKIYVVRVRRMWAYPDEDWVDQRDVLIGDKCAEEIIKGEEDSLKRWVEKAPVEYGGGDDFHGLDELQKELIRYHKSVLPHRTADLIVKLARTDG